LYFKQLVKEDLGCASYIVGCTSAGTCAIVDPRLDMVDDILEITAAKGLQVKAIIETHNHADHVSGHGELSRRTGAEIYVHEQAGVKYPHKTLKDGDELQFGVARLHVIHTPGHRPEHIALAVSDTSRSSDPWLVLTGDSLFIGDIARPDLALSGEEGASELYDSIFNRLFQLDDGVEVYPAHVAGSFQFVTTSGFLMCVTRANGKRDISKEPCIFRIISLLNACKNSINPGHWQRSVPAGSAVLSLALSCKSTVLFNSSMLSEAWMHGAKLVLTLKSKPMRLILKELYIYTHKRSVTWQAIS